MIVNGEYWKRYGTERKAGIYRRTSDAKKAFLGVPDKIWLKPGTKLYKFTDYPLIADNGRITPWWSFVVGRTLPSGRKAEGLRRSEEAAQRLGVSHRDYQKYRAAVSEKFDNNLSFFLLIMLKEGAWGFAGTTSGQPEFKDPALKHFRIYCRPFMQSLNHAFALSAVMSFRESAMVCSRASLVLAWAERSNCLSFAQAFSRGFRSGE